MTDDISQPSHLFGCATSPIIVENAAESPPAQPSFDDCYTTLLHNSSDNQGLSVSDRSGNWRAYWPRWDRSRLGYRTRSMDSLSVAIR